MLTPNTIPYYYFKPGAQTPYRDSATKNILPVIGVRTHAPIIDSRGRWLLPSVVPFVYFIAAPKFAGTGENYGSWIYRRNEEDLPGPAQIVRNSLKPTLWHYFLLNTSGSEWTITPDTTETITEYSQVYASTNRNEYGYSIERTTYQASIPLTFSSDTTHWTYALLQHWHQLTTGTGSTLDPILPIDPTDGTLPMLKTSRETACGADSFAFTTEGPVKIDLTAHVIDNTYHTSRLHASVSGDGYYDGYYYNGSASNGTYQSRSTSQKLFGYLGRNGGSATFGITGSIVIPNTFTSLDGDTLLYILTNGGRVSLQVYRSTNHSALTSTDDEDSEIATVAHTFALDQTIELIAFEEELNKPSAYTSFALPDGLSLDLMANTPYLLRLVVDGSPIASETIIEDSTAQLPLDDVGESISTSSHCQLSVTANLQLELNFK